MRKLRGNPASPTSSNLASPVQGRSPRLPSLPPAPWPGGPPRAPSLDSAAAAERSFQEVVGELTSLYNRLCSDQLSLKAANERLAQEVSALKRDPLANSFLAARDETGGAKAPVTAGRAMHGTSQLHAAALALPTPSKAFTEAPAAVAYKTSGSAETHFPAPSSTEKEDDWHGLSDGATWVPSPIIPLGTLPPEPQVPNSPGRLPHDDDEDMGRLTSGSAAGSVRGSKKRLSFLGQQGSQMSLGESCRQVLEFVVEEPQKQAGDEDFGRTSNLSCATEDSRASFETGTSDDEDGGHHTSLNILGVWDRDPSELVVAGYSRRRTADDMYFQGRSEEDHWCQRHCILTPTGKIAFGWDLFTIIVLLYDLVVIPLQAYPLPASEFWSFMEIAATGVWTFDFVISFIRGYEVAGNIELRPRAIIKHYLRTWFIFDFSIVAMDWVTFFMSQGDMVDLMRFSRVRRALRLLRLARLLKHGQRFLTVFTFVRSENWVVILRIFWLLTALVAINHFISCGWYAIGSAPGWEHQWTKIAFADDDKGFMYMYLTSFHWSVTQFTPASMEIVPKNELERVYNIFIIFFGLLMFSSFVSNMTNSMTYLTKINYEKRQRQNIARTYIVGRGVPLELANDIMRHVAVNQNLRRGLREEDVWAFKSIPKRLLELMRVEVHRPNLVNHALFSFAFRMYSDVFARICVNAVKELALITGEELFSAGTPGKSMYFVTSGVLKCTAPGYGNVEPPPSDILTKQWLCEGALWVVWEHRGRCAASSAACDISELSAEGFFAIVNRSPLAIEVQKYAQAWAKSAALESGGAELVSDFWGQRLRVSDLVQKTLNTGEENDAQRFCRILGGNEYSLDRVFKAWVKFAEEEKEDRNARLEAEKIERRRRRGSFLANGEGGGGRPGETKEERAERRRVRREARKKKLEEMGRGGDACVSINSMASMGSCASMDEDASQLSPTSPTPTSS